MRHKKKIIFGSIGLVALGFAGAIFFMNGSAEGTVVNSYSETSPKKEVTYSKLNGNYVSLSYMSSYSTHNSQARDKTALEDDRFIANTTYDKEMTIQVKNLDGSLDNNSSYHMRTVFTDKYKQSTVKGTNVTATVFAKIDGGEQTAFIQKGNKVATIALVSSKPDDDLTAELAKVVQSFAWTQ